MDECRAAVVICAAGASSRMDGVKKEYQQLKSADESLTVLGSVVRAFASVPSIETIVIAVREDEKESARAAVPPELLSAEKPKILFVHGGKTRRASVFNALLFLVPYKPDYVLIHDGARPWISATLIEEIIQAVKKHGAVIPLIMHTDTPKECYAPLNDGEGGADGAVFIKTHQKRVNSGTAQTPQAFKFPEILNAHEKAACVEDEEFTDDAEIWGRFCGPVAVIPGSADNRKITFPKDNS